MSSAAKAWVVAASVGVVEALKDQGICRWNHAIRSAQHYANSRLRPLSQAANKFSPSSSAVVSARHHNNNSEESLRMVMYLSCWGPN